MDAPDAGQHTAPPRRHPPLTGTEPEDTAPDNPAPDDSEPDDSAVDALLCAAGQGDVRALGVFYDQTAPTVFGLLRGVLGDQAPALEATERVYLHLWRAAPRFDPHRGSARSLLLRTARRELIDRTCTLITATATSAARTRPTERA